MFCCGGCFLNRWPECTDGTFQEQLRIVRHHASSSSSSGAAHESHRSTGRPSLVARLSRRQQSTQQSATQGLNAQTEEPGDLTFDFSWSSGWLPVSRLDRRPPEALTASPRLSRGQSWPPADRSFRGLPPEDRAPGTSACTPACSGSGRCTRSPSPPPDWSESMRRPP